jgi:hypothetical protein
MSGRPTCRLPARFRLQNQVFQLSCTHLFFLNRIQQAGPVGDPFESREPGFTTAFTILLRDQAGSGKSLLH